MKEDIDYEGEFLINFSVDELKFNWRLFAKNETSAIAFVLKKYANADILNIERY